MSTATINGYNSWKEGQVETANLGTDSFVMLLTTSSYTPSASHTVLADITNEVSGNGYSRYTHSIVSSSQTSGTYKLDIDDALFEATTGSIVARYWVIFDDTLAGDPLVAWGLLDNTPADVTVTAGNALTVVVNASGFLTIA